MNMETLVDYTQDFNSLNVGEQQAVKMFEAWNGTGVNNSLGLCGQYDFMAYWSPRVRDKWLAYIEEKKLFPFGYEEVARAVEKRILYRLDRNYRSFIYEEEAKDILATTFPRGKIISNLWLDIVAGIDIAMELDGDYYYFHITKEGCPIGPKEKKSMFKVNGQWITYKRDFSKHMVWTYGAKGLAPRPVLIKGSYANRVPKGWGRK